MENQYCKNLIKCMVIEEYIKLNVENSRYNVLIHSLNLVMDIAETLEHKLLLY